MPAIKKVLVANRGEIACRIIRTLDREGIASAAVYSSADEGALHTRLAREAIYIGEAPPLQSYLNYTRIIEEALRVGADAIHPGYGFLSENAAFADACAAAGVIFIGPRAETIAEMGSKHLARVLMAKAGVPVVPGSAILTSEDDAVRAAASIGYPVMIKASAGGGGIGMHRAINEADVRNGFKDAARKAENFFRDPSVFIEKLIENPRHVEVQVFGDKHGQVTHVFERDCSIQRRHQKVIEETPCPTLPANARAAMLETAVKAARAARYENAGTVEMILAPSGEFYFLEMNTRLQVEHCTTEAVTGIDLVAWQIRAAQGELLDFSSIRAAGHAIEMRICAERPDRKFLPSPGKITAWREPEGGGVRVDAGYAAGMVVPQYYDNLLAKLVVSGDTRAQAIERGQAALANFIIEGISTNIELHKRVLADPEFQAGRYDTGFLKTQLGYAI